MLLKKIKKPHRSVRVNYELPNDKEKVLFDVLARVKNKKILLQNLANFSTDSVNSHPVKVDELHDNVIISTRSVAIDSSVGPVLILPHLNRENSPPLSRVRRYYHVVPCVSNETFDRLSHEVTTRSAHPMHLFPLLVGYVLSTSNKRPMDGEGSNTDGNYRPLKKQKVIENSNVAPENPAVANKGVRNGDNGEKGNGNNGANGGGQNNKLSIEQIDVLLEELYSEFNSLFILFLNQLTSQNFVLNFENSSNLAEFSQRFLTFFRTLTDAQLQPINDRLNRISQIVHSNVRSFDLPQFLYLNERLNRIGERLLNRLSQNIGQAFQIPIDNDTITRLNAILGRTWLLSYRRIVAVVLYNATSLVSFISNNTIDPVGVYELNSSVVENFLVPSFNDTNLTTVISGSVRFWNTIFQTELMADDAIPEMSLIIDQFIHSNFSVDSLFMYLYYLEQANDPRIASIRDLESITTTRNARRWLAFNAQLYSMNYENEHEDEQEDEELLFGEENVFEPADQALLEGNYEFVADDENNITIWNLQLVNNTIVVLPNNLEQPVHLAQLNRNLHRGNFHHFYWLRTLAQQSGNRFDLIFERFQFPLESITLQLNLFRENLAIYESRRQHLNVLFNLQDARLTRNTLQELIDRQQLSQESETMLRYYIQRLENLQIEINRIHQRLGNAVQLNDFLNSIVQLVYDHQPGVLQREVMFSSHVAIFLDTSRRIESHINLTTPLLTDEVIEIALSRSMEIPFEVEPRRSIPSDSYTNFDWILAFTEAYIERCAFLLRN